MRVKVNFINHNLLLTKYKRHPPSDIIYYLINLVLITDFNQISSSFFYSGYVRDLFPLTVNPRYMNIHSKSAWNVVLKLILKCMKAVMLSHWSAQKESCWDVRSFKGLNTIYENIFIVASHKFLIIF